MAHASRFQKPGDYRTFEIAGFSFIVILGKDKHLHAFHNVCRHRAYAVTKKESGSSTVLGCRYHGWSYDTKGHLIKAPEFDNVAGFDKSLNSLWEIQTDIRQGMVFVNFEAGNSIAELDLEGIESIIRSWKIGDMKCVHEWKVEGAFNWKLAGQFLRLHRHYSGVTNGKAEYLVPVTLSKKTFWAWALPGIFRDHPQRLVVSHSTVLQRLPSGRILILRALPLSSNKTLIECNVYDRLQRHTRTTQSEFEATKSDVGLEIRKVGS